MEGEKNVDSYTSDAGEDEEGAATNWSKGSDGCERREYQSFFYFNGLEWVSRLTRTNQIKLTGYNK